MLITSGRGLCAGLESISGVRRPLSTILAAASRQPNSSGFDTFVHWDSARDTQTIGLPVLGCFSTAPQPMSLFTGLVSACACPRFGRDDVKVRRMIAEIVVLLAGKEGLVISSCLKPWLDVSPGPL